MTTEMDVAFTTDNADLLRDILSYYRTKADREKAKAIGVSEMDYTPFSLVGKCMKYGATKCLTQTFATFGTDINTYCGVGWRRPSYNPIDWLCDAAFGGHADVIDLLCAAWPHLGIASMWSSHSIHAAIAKGGYIHMLEYAIARGADFTKRPFFGAYLAQRNCRDMLSWLRLRQDVQSSARLIEGAYDGALEADDPIDLLQWLYTCGTDASRGNEPLWPLPDQPKVHDAFGFLTPIRRGHVHVIQWLYEHGWTCWPRDIVCTVLMDGGNSTDGCGMAGDHWFVGFLEDLARETTMFRDTPVVGYVEMGCAVEGGHGMPVFRWLQENMSGGAFRIECRAINRLIYRDCHHEEIIEWIAAGYDPQYCASINDCNPYSYDSLLYQIDSVQVGTDRVRAAYAQLRAKVVIARERAIENGKRHPAPRPLFPTN